MLCLVLPETVNLKSASFRASVVPPFLLLQNVIYNFTGCGMGLLSPTTFVVINTYFSKRRGRAVGLAFTGTGIGQMFLPFLVDYLQKEYGFNGTLLILSGLALHAFVGALLYRPVKQQMVSQNFLSIHQGLFLRWMRSPTCLIRLISERCLQQRAARGIQTGNSWLDGWEFPAIFTNVQIESLN